MKETTMRTVLMTVTGLVALLVAWAPTVWTQPPIPGVNEFRAIDGTATRPPKSYVQDSDLGSYRIGANNEGFSAGGTLRWDYNATRLKLASGYLFDIGSTSFAEADLAKIDGITNGTAAASKAVVLDANLDASGIRNLTTTGYVEAGANGFTNGARWLRWGTGSPDGVVAAIPGCVYIDYDGGSGATLWVKETGGFSTGGWVAK